MLRGKEECHPSYGIIGWNRMSCGGAAPRNKLFGSPMDNHPTVMVIRIAHAVAQHDLCKDYVFSRDEIVEVQLSPMQFAEFMTSAGEGDGVACTISRLDGKLVEQPQYPMGDFARASQDYTERMQEINARIGRLQKAVTDAVETGDVKKRAVERINQAVQMLVQEVKSNVPFYQTAFMESAERIVTHAKAQVVAYWNELVHRTGIKSLQEGGMAAVPKLEAAAEDLQKE